LNRNCNRKDSATIVQMRKILLGFERITSVVNDSAELAVKTPRFGLG
jgi:hypothetical protein